MADHSEAMERKGPDLDAELAIGNKESWSNLNENALHGPPFTEQQARFQQQPAHDWSFCSAKRYWNK
jgi:hypothetical protein